MWKEKSVKSEGKRYVDTIKSGHRSVNHNSKSMLYKAERTAEGRFMSGVRRGRSTDVFVSSNTFRKKKNQPSTIKQACSATTCSVQKRCLCV